MLGKFISFTILTIFFLTSTPLSSKIDRKALVRRNAPHITSIDTLSSLSVGNGEFAFTCDVTGLQTFHREYANGVSLGTMAQWGWHSFPNDKGYAPSEALKPYDFGRGRAEWYSCQPKEGRGKEAADYLRANPHRLHLGIIGFDGMNPNDISNIDQTLDMWNGVIVSRYECSGEAMSVSTSCDPERDMVLAQITDPSRHGIHVLLPYPTGKHSDDACNWDNKNNHEVTLVSSGKHIAVFSHTLDGQSYFIKICWQHADAPTFTKHSISIKPNKDTWSVTFEFCKEMPDNKVVDHLSSSKNTKLYWNHFWRAGGIVDFSLCTDERAQELERRIVLSQYLLAIQCAGSTPPQETGLTYNSWFGKYHIEMIWWHQSHFALWGHPELLARSLPWYFTALPMAEEIAKRQGFDGVRWMKMTDPSAAEAPSNVGSFLIWQQPHIIYLCELLYRSIHESNAMKGSQKQKALDALIANYASLIDKTARFMASFVTYDESNNRYVIKGCIPAQETLKAAETINPPFELSYWHFALGLAQEWRKRQGLQPEEKWNDIINKLSPLAAKNGVYAAAETADSYPALSNKVREREKVAVVDGVSKNGFEASELSQDIKLYSDHMAVLAACGVLPFSPQYDLKTMSSTLHWVMDNWNWDKTWGWDFPTTCMTAVRCGEPEVAVEALLKDCRTNTYLPNGHNYQDGRLRCYLPGNGGLLTAVALMCAGYDGCQCDLPGFPKNGKWNVKYEGLSRMP